MSNNKTKIKTYPFLDKDNLKKRAKTLNPLIEKAYESFFSMLDLLNGVKNDEYIAFSNLYEKAGLTNKLLAKLEKGIEKLRDLYFSTMTDIFQTRIEDFTTKA